MQKSPHTEVQGPLRRSVSELKLSLCLSCLERAVVVTSHASGVKLEEVPSTSAT